MHNIPVVVLVVGLLLFLDVQMFLTIPEIWKGRRFFPIWLNGLVFGYIVVSTVTLHWAGYQILTILYS